MSRLALSCCLLAAAVPVFAQVVSYEGTSLPQAAIPPWEHNPGFYPGDIWAEDGWFFQHCEIAVPGPPEEGEQDFFFRLLPEMAGFPMWFLEWRMFTNGPENFSASAPSGISASGFSGVLYHFTIAEDQVRLIRDSQLPLVFADIAPGVRHVFRLELASQGGQDSYAFYIDGELIDAGVAEGPYPVTSSRVTWGARASLEDSVTSWDYVRYGSLPAPASGDFDSDGDVDETDTYFFVDCLLGPGASWPGCTWAEMNGDDVADGKDIPLFVDAMLAS